MCKTEVKGQLGGEAYNGVLAQTSPSQQVLSTNLFAVQQPSERSLMDQPES